MEAIYSRPSRKLSSSLSSVEFKGSGGTAEGSAEVLETSLVRKTAQVQAGHPGLGCVPILFQPPRPNPTPPEFWPPSDPSGPALQPSLLPAVGSGVRGARLQPSPHSSYFPPLSWVPVAASPHSPPTAPQSRGVMTHFLSPADIIVPPAWPGRGGGLRPPRSPPSASRRVGAGAAWPFSAGRGRRSPLGSSGQPPPRPGPEKREGQRAAASLLSR
ncbi:uncharacterized protein [Chlorocebus sabaeus]|uniref:uncharacterized protein n=1 Tax=Chlorocebus sabaeus TaxID=60711 RepID=UPI003BFA1BB6